MEDRKNNGPLRDQGAILPDVSPQERLRLQEQVPLTAQSSQYNRPLADMVFPNLKVSSMYSDQTASPAPAARSPMGPSLPKRPHYKHQSNPIMALVMMLLAILGGVARPFLGIRSKSHLQRKGTGRKKKG